VLVGRSFGRWMDGDKLSEVLRRSHLREAWEFCLALFGIDFLERSLCSLFLHLKLRVLFATNPVNTTSR